MPIVVDVRTPDDFKKWIDAQKAAVSKQRCRRRPCCRGSGTAATAQALPN